VVVVVVVGDGGSGGGMRGEMNQESTVDAVDFGFKLRSVAPRLMSIKAGFSTIRIIKLR
jgi:hypothetical protein